MPTTRRALFRILPPSWIAHSQALKAANSTASYWQLETPTGRLRQQFATIKVDDRLWNNHRTHARNSRGRPHASAEIDRAVEALRQVARG